MKKIMTVLLSMMFVLSFCMTAMANSESVGNISYYVEYEGNKATVIFQAGEIGAFDFGVIYDKSELKVEEYDYSEYFYGLQDNDEYTMMYVKNDEAVDKVGTSTYVVFTGACMDADGDTLPGAHRDVAYVTFSGIDEGDEIVVVADTAQYDDVKNAVFIGADNLYKQVSISESYLISNATPEESETKISKTLIFGIVIGVVMVVAIVLVLVSKKNKLDKPADAVEDTEEDIDDL